MKKKKVIFGALAVLILLIAGFGIYKVMNTSPETVEEAPTKKKTTVRNYNAIAVADRPYIKIVPIDARNISIVLEEVKKDAPVVDYELEYQTGTLVQGAFGQIDSETTPVTEKILLGSCSAGGSCTYHEDIKGGELRMFFQGSENYDLKSDWKYFESSKTTSFTSKDAFFQLNSEDLTSNTLLVLYNSPGYPSALSGKLVSEIYTITSNRQLSGTAELSIRAKEEGALEIMGWDGEAWQSFETTSDGKTATATVDLLEAYVVINK